MRSDRDRCRGCRSQCGLEKCDHLRRECAHTITLSWAEPRSRQWPQPISPESLYGSSKNDQSWLLLGKWVQYVSTRNRRPAHAERRQKTKISHAGKPPVEHATINLLSTRSEPAAVSVAEFQPHQRWR